ncbi:DUF2934 domain-containing protein [Mycolicibacterium brisbanense]|uniref:DUF2934 domain-containing protein n=1 Tax=Mycolicibacterium brisbanense TaxID=146020 RepID=A0A100VY53_9MYCO|nr:DUF2934 domain-containing protein [Mycolicibacterium brisbanense]GAS88164.1 putative uncharacterized protein [Mycolicibacterium brisbanense]
MAAKETSTDAGTAKPTTRRTASKRAAAQDNKPARPRKSTVGRATTSAKLPSFTHEMIAERAYHISLSERRGTDEENWHRAEAELRQGS